MPEWRGLLEADPNRHIFLTPEWNSLWWNRFGEGRQEGLVLVFSDPEPVGLAPLTIDRTEQGRRVRFMGGDDLTDYQGPLIASERHRPAVAEAFISYLVNDFDGWDYLEAGGLPVPFHFSEWLVEAADRLKLEFELELHELTAVLMLPANWDDYLAGLGKKKRHELERKTRRFEREAPDAVLRSANEQTLEADIEAFIRLHKTSAGEKGEFMLPARGGLFPGHRAHLPPSRLAGSRLPGARRQTAGRNHLFSLRRRLLSVQLRLRPQPASDISGTDPGCPSDPEVDLGGIQAFRLPPGQGTVQIRSGSGGSAPSRDFDSSPCPEGLGVRTFPLKHP